MSGWLLWMPARAETLRILLGPVPEVIELEADGKTFHGGGIDLMRAIARRAGMEFEFIAYPQARAMLLAQQQADACLPISPLPERREMFKWTVPIVPMRLVLLARSDDPRQLHSLEQARKLRVGAMRGTAVAARLKQQGLVMDESVDYLSGLEKLQLGRLDLWAMLDVGLTSMSRRLGIPQPRVALVVDRVDVAFACNRQVSDEAMARLNQAINAMHADGSFKQFDLN
ncbi:hypothetical protein BI347_13920 [Chromobacterium sphagni]|uniref:Solute-binding protein family 3/N-terminal domain-containing protein n=1 Tax=Chromobacterium sphagni TaxID=1903179 RepID=A0A1S1X4S9_9NEIS|nr:hypothetical protein BI347_13920 [Chromobacterium sphagni]OHX19067.1 hypothetical protein BI344_19530 [Chromobacterium sphagni]